MSDDSFEDDLTITCSNCRSDVFEDSVACPYCGEYLTRDTGPWSEKPTWFWVVALAIIVFLILAFAVPFLI